MLRFSGWVAQPGVGAAGPGGSSSAPASGSQRETIIGGSQEPLGSAEDFGSSILASDCLKWCFCEHRSLGGARSQLLFSSCPASERVSNLVDLFSCVREFRAHSEVTSLRLHSACWKVRMEFMTSSMCKPVIVGHARAIVATRTSSSSSSASHVFFWIVADGNNDANPSVHTHTLSNQPGFALSAPPVLPFHSQPTTFTAQSRPPAAASTSATTN